MKKEVWLIFLFTGLFSSFVWWRYTVASNTTVSHMHAALIRDLSDSIPARNQCSGIEGISRRVLDMPEMGTGSTITLVVTGDEGTALEPRRLKEFSVRKSGRIIEGQQADNRAKETLLTGIKDECEKVTEVPNVSPIFLSILRTVEHLQEKGGPADKRLVFVQTDGEEFNDEKIKSALNARPGSPIKTSAKINNDNVRVIFCGIAETTGATQGNKAQRKSRDRNWQRAERIREVWKSVFTNPDLVRFEPFCSEN